MAIWLDGGGSLLAPKDELGCDEILFVSDCVGMRVCGCVQFKGNGAISDTLSAVAAEPEGI